MDLDLSADQEALRDSVRTVLEAECPRLRVRAGAEERIHGRDAPSPVDGPAQALGWTALTVPESAGGLGLGAAELAVVAEEWGRALAPGPLLVTLSQLVPALRDLAAPNRADELLGAVAAGDLSGALVLGTPGGGTDPTATTITARPTADGYLLRGRAPHVLEADHVDVLVTVARLAESDPSTPTADTPPGAFLVPRAAAGVHVESGLDLTRSLVTLTFDDVTVAPADVLAAPDEGVAATLAAPIEEASLAIALDAVGAAQAAFDMTLAYVKQREQFGVPIGSFQAVKHKCADMYVLLERARALGYYAALTIAEDAPDRALAVAMAKAAAGDAAQRVARDTIQLHGGIGYTWEHDAHLFARRLQTDAVLLGSPSDRRAEVAALLLDNKVVSE